MTPEAEEYRTKLRAIWPELQKKFGVAELGLFGSRVRGDHRPDSDLDVLVTYHSDYNPTLIDVIDLQIRLEEFLGLTIDLAMKPSLKPFLRPFILSEAVAV